MAKRPTKESGERAEQARPPLEDDRAKAPEGAGTSLPKHTTRPVRYQEARWYQEEHVLPMEWFHEVLPWLYEHRGLIKPATVGDQERNPEARLAWYLTHLDRHLPARLHAQVREVVLERVAYAMEHLGLDPFDLGGESWHATLYHHGGFYRWHQDRSPDEGHRTRSRRVTFVLYMHTLPRMFTGGQLEFGDGQEVEPEVGRLVVFDPDTWHRVRRVECYSASPMHGRWTINGWLSVDSDPRPG